MNLGQEFEQYAIKHKGISSNTLHQYKKSVTNLTPYIIEERPMNVASMDVFSRLMMDRIIFLRRGHQRLCSQYCNRSITFFRKYRSHQGYSNVYQ